MSEPEDGKIRILVTGGTSGLGLAITRSLLRNGYNVIITGRNKPESIEHHENLIFLRTDFCNLFQTSDEIIKECRIRPFNIVVNNAGMLGPPDFSITNDGLERTFQVNFLAHLMINEIVIRMINPGQHLKIIAIVSPVYRIADKDLDFIKVASSYSAFKAYSNSKHYLAMMCSYLPVRHNISGLECIGFDPGVFRSGIYRSQKEWFRALYKVASPFMRNPDKIADSLFEIINSKERLQNGVIYRQGGQTERLNYDFTERESFWRDCYEIIEPFIRLNPE